MGSFGGSHNDGSVCLVSVYCLHLLGELLYTKEGGKGKAAQKTARANGD